MIQTRLARAEVNSDGALRQRHGFAVTLSRSALSSSFNFFKLLLQPFNVLVDLGLNRISFASTTIFFSGNHIAYLTSDPQSLRLRVLQSKTMGAQSKALPVVRDFFESQVVRKAKPFRVCFANLGALRPLDDVLGECPATTKSANALRPVRRKAPPNARVDDGVVLNLLIDEKIHRLSVLLGDESHRQNVLTL